MPDRMAECEEVLDDLLTVWTCKIGWAHRDHLPSGSDGPMRAAVARAFKELTGYDDDFIFSGWGGTLTMVETAIVTKQPDPPVEEVFDADMRRLQRLAPTLFAAWIREHADEVLA